MVRIISLINNKGGVGKTTSCLNIGIALGLRGKRVLLIDIDPQGNLTNKFLKDISSEPYTIKDILEEKIQDINLVIKKNVATNIDLIPSNNLLNGTEEVIISKRARETILKRALEPIKNNYDYILLDNPPSLNLLVDNSLTASTEAIIPIAPEYDALTGTSTIIKEMQEIKQYLNNRLTLTGVITTKYDQRTNNDKEIAEAIKQNFKQLNFNTIIRFNVNIKDATNNHTNVINYDPTCNGALDYIALADEIIAQEKYINGGNN
jgi:chromosome partitioning protein